jgi:hypothetical protein
MGITADFLIKHVRPYGMDAYQMVCNDTSNNSLTQWLLANGVTQQEINAAFNLWAGLALVNIKDPRNLQKFCAAAEAISHARWEEYYPTSKSTILFLDEPLIKELSQRSTENVNQSFTFSSFETIPLAITINATDLTVIVNENVETTVAADRNGNCCHFSCLN